jgi:branched-chain amino acid transport system substrate-binding protein
MSVAGLLALMAAVLAGCGSSASGGSSASTAGGSGSKSPIVWMALFPLTGTEGLYQPWVNAGIASVDAINASGGINGHKIDLKICDLGDTANTALQCGQQAVADHAAATFGFPMTASFESYLVSAHIPIFSTQVDPLLFTSPVSFADVGSNTASFATLGKIEGCKKETAIMAFPGTPSANLAFLKAFTTTATKIGLPNSVVLAPATSSDYSPFISKAVSGGADCLTLLGIGPSQVELAQAASSLPTRIKLMTSTGFLSTETIKSMGAVAQRLIVNSSTSSSTDTSNPAVQQWLAAIAKYSPSPKATDGDSAMVWSMVQALETATKKIKGPVTGAATLQALNNMKTYNPGVAPPVSFSSPAPSYAQGPRNFGIWAIIVQIHKDGLLYQVGAHPWYNTFTGSLYQNTVGW